MDSSKTSQIRKFLNYAVFFGVIGAAIAFIVAINQPRQYLAVGKILVIPATTAPNVELNLGYEVGNVVQIINGRVFKENVFQASAASFAWAKQAGKSSTVDVAFYTKNEDKVTIEDAITRIPTALSDYTRDLYGGAPFKYKLLGDPEISVSPVKPNLAAYLGAGFGAGVLACVLYIFLFVFLRVPREYESDESKKNQEEPVKKEEVMTSMPSPNLMEKQQEEVIGKPAAQKAGEGTIEMKAGRPHFVPGNVEAETSSVPDNLPIAGDEMAASGQIEEPSDEEVKERLNRLMRGEL